MKHVIFTFILEHDYETTTKYINKIADKDLDFTTFKETYMSLHEKRIKWKEETIALMKKVMVFHPAMIYLRSTSGNPYAL